MANEIHVDYDSGETLYFVIRNSSGQVWYIVGAAFEAWGTGTRGANDYDYALTGDSGGHYVGSFPVAIATAGRYKIQAFIRDGASPTDGDSLVGGGEIVWNGASEEQIIDNSGQVDAGSVVSLATKILANKAVQNKNTGAVQYYDDDDETVILTHTPTDTGSTIVRTPS